MSENSRDKAVEMLQTHLLGESKGLRTEKRGQIEEIVDCIIDAAAVRAVKLSGDLMRGAFCGSDDQMLEEVDDLEFDFDSVETLTEDPGS